MKQNKSEHYVLAVIALLITLTLFILFLSDSRAADYYPRSVVDVHEDSYLVVRKGPGSSYDTTYVNLASRAIISIMDTHDGWALIQFPKLVGVREPIGWVCMDYLEYDKEMYKVWENSGR